MNQFNFCISHLVFMIIHLQADFVYSQADDTSQDIVSSYEPSLPVVIGILCFMFLLTIVLLLYAKFCRRRAPRHRANQQIQLGLGLPEPQFSGIDKKVIESLPSFTFSSLKGSRDGLECAICLSRFEDVEILRLLPKCRHAFHIHCIDKWLEKHSTCPLCRQKFSAMDLTGFTYPSSFQLPESQSELRVDSNAELFVQREEEHQGSSRFSIGGSFRKIEKLFKQEEMLIQESAGSKSDDQEVFHKFNHKIVLSDVLSNNRWSNVNSSDIKFLNSEMFYTNSSSRFSYLGSDTNMKLSSNSRIDENNEIMKIKEEMEMKILFENRIFAKHKHVPEIGSTSSNTNAQANSIQMSRYVNPGEKRSMSEITGLARYEDFTMKTNKIRVSSLLENNVKNERLRQLWLPIARRTVKWFANKERSQAVQDTTQSVDV